jgi:hypothetical protein
MADVPNQVLPDRGRALRVLLALGLVELVACGSVTTAPLTSDDGAAAAAGAGGSDASAELAPIVEPARDGSAPETIGSKDAAALEVAAAETAPPSSCSAETFATVCINDGRPPRPWTCVIGCRDAAGRAWPGKDAPPCSAGPSPANGWEMVCVEYCGACPAAPP